jgi:hypothetical protein
VNPHQHPLPMTPIDAIESALIIAGLQLQMARTPREVRQAMDRIDELKRERAAVQRQAV